MRVGPERYAEILDLHHQIIRSASGVHRGHEEGTQGDGFFVAFERPRDAIAAGSISCSASPTLRCGR